MIRNIMTLAVASIASFVAPGAFGGQYFSAHFCQPYKNGGEPQVQSYYQNQGSIVAVAESTHVCPVHAEDLIGVKQIRVYYSTQGVTEQPPIACRMWKISTRNETLVGPMAQGFAGEAANYMDVFSNEGPLGAVGANLECILKPRAKILGYFFF